MAHIPPDRAQPIQFSRGDFGGATGAALPPAILSGAGDPIPHAPILLVTPTKPATTPTCRHTTRRD
uniref:Uncharacterized protein n=1 Tax=Oryza glumipatula TaxID=40148 RepID=A0A0E0ALX7_9ORYZ